MSRSLLIVDPLTLIGRELLSCLEDRSPELDLSFVHTAIDDEHQIAELAGEAGLVPPLDDPSVLDRADLVVVTSDLESDRLTHVRDWIAERPGARVVDLGRTPTMRAVTRSWAGGAPPPETTAFRIAHPAITAAWHLASALESVGVSRGHLAAVDPVSHRGLDSIEALARQGTDRLQGHAVKDTIDGHVLAFGYVAVDPDDLQSEAGSMLGSGWSVDHSLVGCFHGHVAHVVIDLDQITVERDLLDLLESDPALEIRPRPLGLDTVPDTDRILVAGPRLLGDGSRFTAVLMMDGLRIGGALTGVDLIARLS